MKRFVYAFLLCLAAVLLCVGCSEQAYTRQAFLLDTVVRITLYDQDDKTMDACFALIAECEAALSRTDPESELARLNARLIDTVSDETAELIADALAIAALTDGAFDPTVGRLCDLWNFSAVSPTLPDEEAIARAIASVGYAGVGVDGSRVQFDHAETMLDLGAIAKGEIADRVCALLRERGVDRAIINLGGNVVVLGGTEEDPYRVGVQDPASPPGNSLLSLAVTDATVVTSGIYNRGFTVDGQYYHHILDPRTGYPVENTLASVTIISSNSRQADALSTACMVLGETDAMALIEATEGVDAILITRSGEVLFSAGVEEKYDVQFLREEGND